MARALYVAGGSRASPRCATNPHGATDLMALPFGETPGARDSKALAILAKTIYRELRGNGFQTRDVMALASELLSLVAHDVRGGASAAKRRGD